MSDKNTVSLNLKALIVPSKTVEVEYPGMPDFKLKLAFLSRETLVTLRKKATQAKYVRGKLTEESLDEELFISLFAKESIRGWSGFKLKYLEQLVPTDLSGQDLEKELEYNEDNALLVLKNSSDFDSFVNSIITDLGKLSDEQDELIEDKLTAFINNSEVSMTKEAYFDMCRQLGTQPIESEIPVDLSDFGTEVQLAVLAWQYLPDDIDTFNGNYLGKKLEFFKQVFELLEIPKEDYLFTYKLVNIINKLKVKQFKQKKPQAGPKAPQ